MGKVAQTRTPDTQLFRDVFNASPIGIAVENLEGQPLFMNAAFCSMLGFSEEELRNKHCVDFSPPEDAAKDWALFQQLKAGSVDHYQLEKRYFRKDRSLVWGRLSISLLNSHPSPLVIAMVEDITDKKRAEEARFRHAAIVESSDDAIISKNLDGVIVSWNRGAQRIYGYTEEEAVGKPITILVPRELVDEEDKILERVRAGESIEHYETLRVTKEEKGINISLSVSPIKDSSGRILGLCSISRDISDRKRGENARRLAEQEFAKANERLQLAMEAGAAGGWDYDLKTGKDVWFGAAHAQLGMTRDETLGSPKEFWDRVHGDDRERLEHALQVAKEKREDFGEDVRVVWRDGTTHWLRSRGRFHYAANGEPERSVGISLDITERKRAEEALLRYAAIVESSKDAIISKNLDAVIVTWNAGAQRMFGYTENEAVGKHVTIIVPPELTDEENKILETLRAGGRIEQFETVRVTKTGKRIDISLSISPIKDSTGKTVGYAGIERDITKRKRAEQALLSSEKRYRLLFERNVAGVATGSLDGRVLDCNEGWARILGYESRGEVLGRHASEFYFNPEEREPLLDELREKQAVFSRELQLKRKDGSPVWVLFNAAALNAEQGAPILQATMIDISEWKRSDEALSGMTRKLIESQEQERARIGRELHDDINQRLAMLSLEAEQLLETPSEIENRVQEFRKRISEISTDVQDLSHDLHSSKLEYLGVVAGIKSWCKEFGERQRVEIDFSNDVHSALPFEIGLSLFRVLQESLHNAMKHSGVKRIEVQLREDSGEIHLIIRDSGKGFDVEAALQGKGLGLTSMRERVRLVNGTFSIESKPMGGTTIHVRVPLESKHAAKREAV
jgi:PAS domain S-box-containing protein